MFKFWRKRRKWKYKVGDKIIYVNDFGVAYCWTISERTLWENYRGELLNAYHYEGTQTPWFPILEEDIRHKAKRGDDKLSFGELKTKYGFTPTEWYGCY